MKIKKQTGLEWFLEWITNNPDATSKDGQLAIKKANEIDTNNIENAWERGKYIGENFAHRAIEPEYEQSAKEYYEQTYGKQN